MTAEAIAAVCKHVRQNILNAINDNLVMGSLCTRDYNQNSRMERDIVTVPSDPADLERSPLQYCLTRKTFTFQVPDVTDVLMSPGLLLKDCERATGYLCGCIERELIQSLVDFKAAVPLPHTGITPLSLQQADEILFAAGSLASGYLITGDHGWKQIEKQCGGKAGTFEVCSPSPDDEPYLLTNAAFTSGALCLVTRRLTQTTPIYTTYAETDDIGFTITAAPTPPPQLLKAIQASAADALEIASPQDSTSSSDARSLTINVDLLFGAGVALNERGVRIPLPSAVLSRVESELAAKRELDYTDGGQSGNEIPASLYGDGTVRTPAVTGRTGVINPCGDRDPLTVLVDLTTNPLITRFQATLDSLSDLIPDRNTRLQKSLQLLLRTDHITSMQLLEACTSQLLTLRSTDDAFSNYINARRTEEIVRRETAIAGISAEIEGLHSKIKELEQQSRGIGQEIEQHTSLIRSAEEEFDTALGIVDDSIRDIELLLTGVNIASV